MGNNALGLVGVNWTVLVMALKFLDSGGSGSNLGAAAAVRYAADHGARVSNNSYAGGGGSTLSNAITHAGTMGSIVVAAAGNDGLNTDTSPSYPSAFPQDNIIAVAAVDGGGSLAGFSNYGAQTVDIGAPGVGILSTVPNGGYGYLSGTSMAAPHVAGAVALLLAQHPDWTYGQIIQRILTTTTPLASLAGKTLTGGIINAAAVVVPAAGRRRLAGASCSGTTSGRRRRGRRGGRRGELVLARRGPEPGGAGAGRPAEGDGRRRGVPARRGDRGAGAGRPLAGGRRGAGGGEPGADGRRPGYNLLFRDGGVQFLDDHRAWGPLLRVRMAGGGVVPVQAPVVRRGAVRQGVGGRVGGAVGLDVHAVGLGGPVRAGAPGLNGGSGGSTASFDDVAVSGSRPGRPSRPRRRAWPPRPPRRGRPARAGRGRATPRPTGPIPARGGGPVPRGCLASITSGKLVASARDRDIDDGPVLADDDQLAGLTAGEAGDGRGDGHLGRPPGEEPAGAVEEPFDPRAGHARDEALPGRSRPPGSRPRAARPRCTW